MLRTVITKVLARKDALIIVVAIMFLATALTVVFTYKNKENVTEKKIETEYTSEKIPKTTSKTSTVESTEPTDKTSPVVNGIENGKQYEEKVTATFADGTATLDGTAYQSGTEINTLGSHTLVVVNESKNVTTITFSIISKVPEVTASSNPDSNDNTSTNTDPNAVVINTDDFETGFLYNKPASEIANLFKTNFNFQEQKIGLIGRSYTHPSFPGLEIFAAGTDPNLIIKMITIKDNTHISINGIRIGDTKETVLAKLGTPIKEGVLNVIQDYYMHYPTESYSTDGVSVVEYRFNNGVVSLICTPYVSFKK